MNKIRQPALVQIVKVFPNLFCLDASFNDVCEMNGALNWISKLEKLRMLSLEGNPLVLTPDYANAVIAKIPTLKVIDGVSVSLEVAKAAAEAVIAAARGSRLGSAPSQLSVSEATPLPANMSLDL